jgi:glucokinase
MLALGIDLSDRAVRAIVVDETGRVSERHAADASDGLGTASIVAVEADVVGVATAEGDAGSAVLGRLSARTHTVQSGAAAIAAEVWLGVAQNARHAVCLSIGERVFAGLLLDGRPWTGAHGLAGAAAWLALNPVERQDYRKYGSLAAEVSAKGIARRLSWRIQAGDHSSVLERAGDLDAITAAHVFEGARSGDGVAISVVRDTAKYIGMAVANLAATLDPEVIVIGGSVSAAADLLLDPVRQECSRRLPPGATELLRVEFSSLGEDAVALGAARLAMTA